MSGKTIRDSVSGALFQIGGEAIIKKNGGGKQSLFSFVGDRTHPFHIAQKLIGLSISAKTVSGEFCHGTVCEHPSKI